MADAEAVQRFRADLEGLTGDTSGKLGVAVSGGPDSLALLLLAHAAWPGRVETATVDHRLRAESAGEAAGVAVLCARIGVPHTILTAAWKETPAGNLPAKARDERYRLLVDWAARSGLAWLATAHHRDDQAETILMRLARGAGLGGLSGVRPLNRAGRSEVGIVRPLLGWSKRELADIVATAGIAAADDATNRSEKLDRTRVRALLAATPSLDPGRLAASAAHLAEAEEAIEWAAEREFHARTRTGGGAVELDASGLPRELRRRLLLRCLNAFTDSAAIPGPKLARLLDTLDDGRPATLAGVRVRPGPPWRFERAPARRVSSRVAG